MSNEIEPAWGSIGVSKYRSGVRPQPSVLGHALDPRRSALDSLKAEWRRFLLEIVKSSGYKLLGLLKVAGSTWLLHGPPRGDPDHKRWPTYQRMGSPSRR